VVFRVVRCLGPSRVSLALLALLTVVAFRPGVGQTRQGDLAKAFEAENGGRYQEAATGYVQALKENPTNLAALLGLDRVLRFLNELPEILPYIDSALVVQPQNRSVRALGLAVWATLNEPDKLDEAARAWIAIAPGNTDPYSEWARVVANQGRLDDAQQILADAMEELGDRSLLRDMAELSVAAGEWVQGASQWRDAVEYNGAFATSAVASLSPAPREVRDWVVGSLTEERDTIGAWLASDLLVGWDRPLDGWTLLMSSLPQDNGQAAALLRRFADRARLNRTPEGNKARAYAYEQLAKISSGTAADRFRVEAARAFADAGDRRSAERMLEAIAAASQSGDRSAASAAVSLITVMAESGRVEDAEQRFYDWQERLTPDDIAVLRDKIAWAWIREGKLPRAERILEADSTVATLAVRGWVALFNGNLRSATEFFRAAGPRTGTRSQATERVAMVALVQQIEPDTVPPLGAALLSLAQGDTADAVDKLDDVARQLPRTGGRAAVWGYGGRLALERGDAKSAERMLRGSVEADPEAPAAPTAHFDLARTFQLTRRADSAQQRLEFLILNYPDSAMLPLARRLLDQIQGRVPSS
jgi:tetratricopeptide (TPR) repeat protein